MVGGVIARLRGFHDAHGPSGRQLVRGLLITIAVFVFVRAEVRVTGQGRELTAQARQLRHDDRLAREASDEVKHLLVSQTDNRVKNVGIWCDHFVTLESVIVAYVGGVAGAPHIPLNPLTAKDCEAIARGTAKSTTVE